MRRVVHPDDDQGALHLLDAETRWYYNLYLQSLGRYLEIKQERDEIDKNFEYGRQSLLSYARWMAENEYPYLSKPEILEYPTETWSAQDLRKSEVFHFAARHCTGKDRQAFLERGKFFYEHSLRELSESPTASYCRPIALLLGSGFSYDGIRSGTHLDAGEDVATGFAAKPLFTPQKQHALRRAKVILGIATAVCALAAVAGLTQLLT